MFDLKSEKFWVKFFIALISIAVFILSIYTIFHYNNYFLLGDLEKMDDNDDVKFIRSALTLLDQGMLVYRDIDQPTVYMMPGIAFILAFFLKLFGLLGGLTAFRIFQAVLHVFSILLLFFLVRDVFNNSKLGLLACLIDATYIPNIANVGFILTEEAFEFFMLLLMYISLYAIKTRQYKYYLWGGVILGLACLIRPIIALYPLVVVIMWFLYQYSWKDMLKYASVTLLAFVVVMSPWWIRNYVEFHRIIPLTLSSGNPFLQGTYLNYDQTKDYTDYPLSDNEIEKNEIEIATGIYRLKTYFPQHPMEYIHWYTLGKTYYNWHYPYYNRPIFDVSWNFLLRYHAGIIFMSAFGMLATLWKDRKKFDRIFIILVIVYFNGIYLPYLTCARYVFPVMPLMISFAAVGIFELYSFLMSKPTLLMNRNPEAKF